MPDRSADLRRIDDGLSLASTVLAPFVGGSTAVSYKPGGEPVTAADLAVDRALAESLPSAGEGWMSEETADSPARLACRRVWVVDPVDGTAQFLAGLPEYSVSIGLIEDGRAVAGGVLNPVTNQRVVGAVGDGVWLDGRACHVRARQELTGSLVLASRSETRRGEWRRWEDRDFVVKPMGSVAWKLALVAAGLADATWSLIAKHEWDVAAGAALVEAAGGRVLRLDGEALRFNQRVARIPGLLACSPGLTRAILDLLESSNA
jgi:myo-inositol-1(or 4)-monophosphatase